MEKKIRTSVNDIIIKEMLQKTQSLRYGLVAMKVHDGKIIQVEITEKTRFDDRWISEEGGGI